jgi:hypothetical protein
MIGRDLGKSNGSALLEEDDLLDFFEDPVLQL